MAEPLLERLDRWAENLPPAEEIPIVADEAMELAEWEAMRHAPCDISRAARFFEAIFHGHFIYRGHRVRLL